MRCCSLAMQQSARAARPRTWTAARRTRRWPCAARADRGCSPPLATRTPRMRTSCTRHSPPAARGRRAGSCAARLRTRPRRSSRSTLTCPAACRPARAPALPLSARSAHRRSLLCTTAVTSTLVSNPTSASQAHTATCGYPRCSPCCSTASCHASGRAAQAAAVRHPRACLTHPTAAPTASIH